MSDSVRIDCGICGDLAPLAEDGVACQQSRRAVLEHMAACPACREKYAVLLSGEGPREAAEEAVKDDAKIIGRVRERVSGWLLAAVMISLLLGALLTAGGTEPWLMLLIFPAICGAVYLRGIRLWKWVPLMAMALWVIVTLLMSGGRLMDIPIAFVLGVIPLGLSYIGALAAALLKYAFKGEF